MPCRVVCIRTAGFRLAAPTARHSTPRPLRGVRALSRLADAGAPPDPQLRFPTPMGSACRLPWSQLLSSARYPWQPSFSPTCARPHFPMVRQERARPPWRAPRTDL